MDINYVRCPPALWKLVTWFKSDFRLGKLPSVNQIPRGVDLITGFVLTWSGALSRRREICAITLIPNSIIISSYPKTIETFSSSGNNPTAS